ncbi:MAG: peptidase U32 family protein [Paeniclostridium sordellii]|uniref:U32 family peptidase n=1 Tax=Paeniclostridium hominis TaxID=2764329 RepID=A0ABR7K4P9_9FIRM|nr:MULTISPECIES: peptidase U32 family protein [Paeniclostridium]MBC6003905.1 U32 family peptidase [Paeniclostridium hominis]MBC8631100.1 U32 family peptidase [[Eubacterium] tenue]MDU1538864.1 peptidase U32 family protein [Paeniclostridium sordellii]MDU2592445.1 peptidase U32 family protein [Paeniclostridium sordellii]
MHKIELLSSAKDLNNLKIALESGADAVYIGGDSFGIDAIAKNFSKEDLENGINFAHEKGKKVYIAVNVMPHNEDFDKLQEYLLNLEKLKVDAIIVSDPGVLAIVKETIPKVRVHMGQQANVTNYNSANFWYNQGIKRIIVTSELSFDEINTIRAKTPLDLEIEAFVHGPICISYSGRRLISSYLNGKDNVEYEKDKKRYNLLEEKRQGEYYPVYEDEKGTFFFNSKDLCMLKFIPEFIKSGVTSLKIDGRLQSDEYLETVIKVYREALDKFYKNPNEYEFDSKWLEKIQSKSHRPLTNGFYTGESMPDDYE